MKKPSKTMNLMYQSGRAPWVVMQHYADVGTTFLYCNRCEKSVGVDFTKVQIKTFEEEHNKCIAKITKEEAKVLAALSQEDEMDIDEIAQITELMKKEVDDAIQSLYSKCFIVADGKVEV